MDLQLTPEELRRREILQNSLTHRIAERNIDIRTAMEKIEADGTLLHDYLVPTNRMSLQLLNGIILATTITEDNMRFSDFSIGQLSEKMGVPVKYLRRLWNGNDWEKELAVNIVNKHAGNIARDRLLIREVDGQIRGILSDSYRRLNSMQIYLAFLDAVKDSGAVLIDAHSGDTRGYLEVIMPEIQSVQTEKNGIIHMGYGAQIRNSDFGDGALELRMYEMQVVCMNGMVTDSVLREIHLGRRLPDDLKISETTYQKDTSAMASLVKDAISQVFSPEYILAKQNRIQTASSMDIDIQKEVKQLPQLGFTQEEVADAETKLMNNNPNDGIQGQNTLWKFAQTIGAVARDAKDNDRKRELQDIAGDVMMRVE
jgi:hypothetical protein